MCTSKNVVSIKWISELDDTLIMIYYIKETHTKSLKKILILNMYVRIFRIN
jgi:hypothetical protein